MSKTRTLRFGALAATGLGVAFAVPAAHGDFIITPVVGATSGGDVDYVLTALNNGLHGTGSAIKAFDLTVTTPGSGTNGALVIDLSDDINGDGVADANVGAQPDLSFDEPTPSFGSDLGTFIGLASAPLVQPLSSNEPGVLTIPAAVKVNGSTAVYLSSKSAALSAPFTSDTVHSLEVASILTNGVIANVTPIPFANIVLPAGTQFSFSGTLTGSGGSSVVVSSPQSAASGPVISLTGTMPGNSNSIGSITEQGSLGGYSLQSTLVTGNAQTTGFLTVHGFNPTGDKEIYGLALDVDGTFLPQTAPLLASIINDLNTALGSSGTASLITPAMASFFPTNTYDAMITFANGPTPSSSSPAIFAYDLSGYTTNGTVTISQIAVIPEPTSGLLALGGLGLLARRRRRSGRASSGEARSRLSRAPPLALTALSPPPYIPLMRLLAMAGLLALVLGCQGPVLRPPAAQQPPDERALFGPVAMRLHPVFTQVKSFSGGATPDGIEAVLEFDDQFGDPTKAAGAVIFELYDFRNGYPDLRGERLVEPWTATLASVSQQHAHWRREISAYSFLLADEKVRLNRNYVLTATFEPLTGPRLFAQTVITAQPGKK